MKFAMCQNFHSSPMRGYQWYSSASSSSFPRRNVTHHSSIRPCSPSLLTFFFPLINSAYFKQDFYNSRVLPLLAPWRCSCSLRELLTARFPTDALVATRFYAFSAPRYVHFVSCWASFTSDSYFDTLKLFSSRGFFFLISCSCTLALHCWHDCGCAQWPFLDILIFFYLHVFTNLWMVFWFLSKWRFYLFRCFWSFLRLINGLQRMRRPKLFREAEKTIPHRCS